jgi:hypothetical protein
MANGDMVTVNIPDFSMPSSLEFDAQAGQTSTTTFHVAPLSSTPSSVVLTAVSVTPPIGTALTFTPSTVNLNGSPVQVTLTLTMGTAVPQSVAKPRKKSATLLLIGRGGWWMSTGVCWILVIYLLCRPGRPRRYRAAMLVGTRGVLSLVLGCGGGGGGGGGGAGRWSRYSCSSNDDDHYLEREGSPGDALYVDGNGHVFQDGNRNGGVL